MAFYSNHASAPKFRQTLVLDDYDVFGDGIVQLISAPGHTPWHQLLYLKLEETGPLLLSGDLYHFRLSRVGRRVPVFNVDGPQTLASMTLVIHTNTRSPFW